VPYAGELTCEHVDELTPQRYRCGQVWGICIEVAGIRIYHQGSADLIEDEIRDRGVDLFLCGISGRRFTPRYVERIVRALAPQRIVPTHYDDFFRPLERRSREDQDDKGEREALESEPAAPRFSLNVNLTGFAEDVHRASRELPIATLAVGARIG
jgi:L-ascorbate metabolism protein UlaG (beta-lactamase superfamily)